MFGVFVREDGGRGIEIPAVRRIGMERERIRLFLEHNDLDLG